MSQQPWNNGQPTGGPQGGFRPPQGGPQQGAGGYGGPQQNHGAQQPGGYANQQGGYPNQQGGYPPGGPGGPGGPVATKKKSKVPFIVGGVVAAGLLAGGGYFAFNFFNGTSPAAATEGIPQDAVAVVEVSLNPSDADKLALKNIVEKFPAAADMPETDDYKEVLWELVTQDDSGDIDYQEDVKPWLGDSISFGVFADEEKGISPLISVEVTDKGKADAFMQEHADDKDFKHFFHDKLMVIEDESLDVEESLKKGSIKDDENYKADMEALEGSNLASAWITSDALELMLRNANVDESNRQVLEQVEALKAMHGAVGLHVAENELSLYTSFAGDKDNGKGEDVRELVGSLPKDAPIAFGASLNDQMFTQIWELVSDTQGAQDQLAQMGIESEDDLKALLGKQIAGAVDGFIDGGDGQFGVKIKTDDIERHQGIVNPLFEQLESQGGKLPVEREADGDTAIYAHGYSIDDVKGGSLKDDDLYKKVISGDAQSLIFVNVGTLVKDYGSSMPDDLKKNLEPIAAIGMTGTSEGKRGDAVVRVVFNN